MGINYNRGLYGHSIAVEKGVKKGRYKLRVKVSAAGNNKYKAKAVIRTVTIKVK